MAYGAQIRFLEFAGRRVAYATSGEGPPLVAPAWWISHVELDWADRAFRDFWEHVRAESPRLASWQDRLANPWQRFARGCRCNRAIAEWIAACGFELEPMRSGAWRGMPPVVRPLVMGRARPAATTSGKEARS